MAPSPTRLVLLALLLLTAVCTAGWLKVMTAGKQQETAAPARRIVRHPLVNVASIGDSISERRNGKTSPVPQTRGAPSSSNEVVLAAPNLEPRWCAQVLTAPLWLGALTRPTQAHRRRGVL